MNAGRNEGLQRSGTHEGPGGKRRGFIAGSLDFSFSILYLSAL